MSFADAMKGLVEKGQELAAENKDKVEQAIDKAGDIFDEKTGGKYAKQVDSAQDAAKNAIPNKGDGAQ